MMQTIDVCHTTEFHSILTTFLSGHEKDTNFEENICKTFTFLMAFVLGLNEWINLYLKHGQSTFMNDADKTDGIK